MTETVPSRTVLNMGSGPRDRRRLHPAFHGESWREVRIDIDPAVAPDIVGDISDMRGTIADASFDALWSSHNIEHLEDHRVAPAFAEMARVLRNDGFALVTCPDLEAVARFVARSGPDVEAYRSPAGPIAAVDMLWGHRASIAAGSPAMAHRTGFGHRRLAALAREAGFPGVRVATFGRFDLWGLFLKPDCRWADVAVHLAGTPQKDLARPAGVATAASPRAAESK